MFSSTQFCISSFTSIFSISFSKYTEFSRGNSRIITDPTVGGKSSCPSLLLHHPFEHHRVVLSFLCWHFILNVECLCLLCVCSVPFNHDSFSFSFQAKVGFCIHVYTQRFAFSTSNRFDLVHIKHYLIPLLFLFLQEKELM